MKPCKVNTALIFIVGFWEVIARTIEINSDNETQWIVNITSSMNKICGVFCKIHGSGNLTHLRINRETPIYE